MESRYQLQLPAFKPETPDDHQRNNFEVTNKFNGLPYGSEYLILSGNPIGAFQTVVTPGFYTDLRIDSSLLQTSTNIATIEFDALGGTEFLQLNRGGLWELSVTLQAVGVTAGRTYCQALKVAVNTDEYPNPRSYINVGTLQGTCTTGGSNWPIWQSTVLYRAQPDTRLYVQGYHEEAGNRAMRVLYLHAFLVLDQ